MGALLRLTELEQDMARACTAVVRVVRDDPRSAAVFDLALAHRVAATEIARQIVHMGGLPPRGSRKRPSALRTDADAIAGHSSAHVALRLLTVAAREVELSYGEAEALPTHDPELQTRLHALHARVTAEVAQLAQLAAM